MSGILFELGFVVSKDPATAAGVGCGVPNVHEASMIGHGAGEEGFGGQSIFVSKLMMLERCPGRTMLNNATRMHNRAVSCHSCSLFNKFSSARDIRIHRGC